jgi:hypothetical protein
MVYGTMGCVAEYFMVYDTITQWDVSSINHSQMHYKGDGQV